MSLLALGSIGLDEIITQTEESGIVAGGSAQYIAWAASVFAPVNMVSIAGDDFPQEELDALKKHNVNLDGLEIVKDGKTFYWKGKYYDDMNRRDSIVTELNVLENFNPILPESYKKSDFVMLGNLHPNIQTSILDQLYAKPLFVGLDTMNFWMDVALTDLKEAIKRVDILFVNDSEAMQLSGENNLKRAIRRLQSMGPRYICIKKGEHGVILASAEEVFICPALLLGEVVDPTGAGDCFAGGMMGYLADKREISFSLLRQAIIRGSVMASFCVERFSNRALRFLDKKKIDERTEELIAYITIR